MGMLLTYGLELCHQAPFVPGGSLVFFGLLQFK